MTAVTPCDECMAKIRAWENTKPSTHGHRANGIRIASHATYDDRVAGARDNGEARWQVWRDLVVSQIGLIHTICAAQHQPGQTELFSIDEERAA